VSLTSLTSFPLYVPFLGITRSSIVKSTKLLEGCVVCFCVFSRFWSRGCCSWVFSVLPMLVPWFLFKSVFSCSSLYYSCFFLNFSSSLSFSYASILSFSNMLASSFIHYSYSFFILSTSTWSFIFMLFFSFLRFN
jgi:hypothetical protein